MTNAPAPDVPTPLTDALQIMQPVGTVWLEHARRLERELSANRAVGERARETLERALRWHHGDKWREGDSAQRAAWEEMRDRLVSDLTALSAPGQPNVAPQETAGLHTSAPLSPGKCGPVGATPNVSTPDSERG